MDEKVLEILKNISYVLNDNLSYTEYKKITEEIENILIQEGLV